MRVSEIGKNPLNDIPRIRTLLSTLFDGPSTDAIMSLFYEKDLTGSAEAPGVLLDRLSGKDNNYSGFSYGISRKPEFSGGHFLIYSILHYCGSEVQLYTKWPVPENLSMKRTQPTVHKNSSEFQKARAILNQYGNTNTSDRGFIIRANPKLLEGPKEHLKLIQNLYISYVDKLCLKSYFKNINLEHDKSILSIILEKYAYAYERVLPLAEILLSQGEEIDVIQGENHPLNIVVKGLNDKDQQIKLTSLLLENNADPNGGQKDGIATPLHTVISSLGFNEIAELLLSYGADVERLDKDGKNPVQLTQFKSEGGIEGAQRFRQCLIKSSGSPRQKVVQQTNVEIARLQADMRVIVQRLVAVEECVNSLSLFLYSFVQQAQKPSTDSEEEVDDLSSDQSILVGHKSDSSDDEAKRGLPQVQNQSANMLPSLRKPGRVTDEKLEPLTTPDANAPTHGPQSGVDVTIRLASSTAVPISPEKLSGVGAVFQEASRRVKPQMPDRTLSFDQQVTQKSMTVLGKYVTSDDVRQFLDWIQEGHLIEVENCLKRNAYLAYAQADVYDRFEREQSFEQITAFQYTFWALDIDMCKVILKYIERADAAIQRQALPDVIQRASRTVKRHTLQDQFDLTHIVKKYDELDELVLLDKESLDFYNEVNIHWQTSVGGEQRQLPAWIVYVFSETRRDDVSWDNHEFNRLTIDRRYDFERLNWFFHHELNDGLLGSTWAATRLGRLCVPQTNPRYSSYSVDAKFLRFLKSWCEQHVEEIVAYLSDYKSIGLSK